MRRKWELLPIAVKVSTAYAICSIIQQGIGFITLPLFTRLLSVEQYGQVTIYTSWQGILQIFLTLNLAYGSFSAAMMKFEEDRDGYISSVEGICLGLTGLFLALYLPFRDYWNKLFDLPTYIIFAMSAQILCMLGIQLWMGKKRFEFKYKNVVIVTLVSAMFSPFLQYLFVVNSSEKGYARIMGMVTAACVIDGTIFIYNAFLGRKLYNRKYWKYALGFNIPLLTYYLSQIVFNQSDRIMISHMAGKDKAAIYGVAYSLAMVLNFVLNAINNSYVPWFYRKLKEGNQIENKKVAPGIAAIMAFLLSGVIWFAPEIILILAGQQYLEAVYVIPPVAISLLLLFYSQLFINVEFYFEEKGMLVWASVGAAIANLLLNWIFIKALGYVAAAYTTLFSYILFAGANFLTMKRILKGKKFRIISIIMDSWCYC